MPDLGYSCPRLSATLVCLQLVVMNTNLGVPWRLGAWTFLERKVWSLRAIDTPEIPVTSKLSCSFLLGHQNDSSWDKLRAGSKTRKCLLGA